jgi:AAA domain
MSCAWRRGDGDWPKAIQPLDSESKRVAEAARQEGRQKAARSSWPRASIFSTVVSDVGDVGLVTVDPITAFMGGKVDTHKATDVRSQLGPLADLAERMDVAISAITHPAKNAGPRALRRASDTSIVSARSRSSAGALAKNPASPM